MGIIVKQLALLAAFLLFACNDGSTGSSSTGAKGQMVVQITDAPLDRSLVASATIDVAQVKVHLSANGDSGFLTLFSGPPITVDLLALSNGVVQQLANAPLPVGTYHQVRLIVSDARLVLTNGNVFTTANGNLDLTSLNTSGLKVFIEPKIDVFGGVSTTLLLDIDLSRTFHPIPSNNPLTASSFQLMPVIKAHNLAETGEVRGRVLLSDGAGGTVGVADANVFVVPPGETDPLNAVAGTGTFNDGSFRIIGVLPGNYDVLAMKGVAQGTVAGQVVTLGNVTTVDVTIQ
ncbi:MAG TPA: DUF4382 domain-containing protein [Planctomycetota bacterium]|nr:DUF4382 domain-containing protein [Planctomycetota bacterium]